MTEGYIRRCFLNLREDGRYTIAVNLIKQLEDKGYEAYLVGGCVRDALMFRTPKDFDIATSATTNQIKEVFKNYKIIETGIKHGTVTVVLNSFGDDLPFEITTYRVDGNYSDGRHPDSVKFIANLKEDLARRDFTINAMAYNPSIGLVDYFDGAFDLHHEVIRCVGSPVKRFAEDGLRIMRAMRFAVTLNFKIDRNTVYGMRVCASNLENVSKERVCAELDKMVTEPNFSTILIDYPDIISKIIPAMEGMMWCTSDDDIVDLYNDVASSMRCLKDSLSKEAAYALLFRDLKIGSPDCYPKLDSLVEKTVDMAVSIMKDLKFDNKTLKSVVEIIRWSFCGAPKDKYELRLLIGRIGKENALNLINMMKVHSNVKSAYSWTDTQCAYALCLYNEVKDESTFGVKDLDINGDDMVEIGYSGAGIKSILDRLLHSYFADALPNEHGALYKAAKEYYEYSAKIPF